MVKPSYWPTKPEVVEVMLDRADLKPGESLCDLGSGDGRVVRAALNRGAVACGVELDAELARKSAALGLTIHEGDLMAHRLSPYDVVTGFFEDADAHAVMNKFYAEAKNGARLILHVGDEVLAYAAAR